MGRTREGRRGVIHQGVGRRGMFALAGACVLILTFLFAAGTAAAGPETVIAWTPSHQDDTGHQPWHEYLISGDITTRTMALLGADYTNVLCWETGMGLTSRNIPALKSETDQANAAGAQIFISVHVNAGAASGFIGLYQAGDSSSARYAETLLRSVASTMGMRFWYVSGRTDLVGLDPANNKAPIRVVLELGDEMADRELLLSEDGRQRLAEALAQAVRQHTPPPLHYQQNDSRIAYTGTWTVFSTSGASGGSYRYAAAPSTATVWFDGTRLDWIATKGVTMGMATVSLDGGDPVPVNLYNSTVLRQQKVWTTEDLPAGLHKLVVSWTGKPGAGGGGNRVNIDALEVMGKLVQAPKLTRVEQNDSRIAYTGTWTVFSTSGASGGSYRYAAAPSTATIWFDGTRLDWIATKGVTMGRATVSLDGGDPVPVNLYNSSVVRQQKVWSSDSLEPGLHKLVIKWTGQPSVTGGGIRVNIDALDVMGTLIQVIR